MKWHPDKNNTKEANAQFQKINEAIRCYLMKIKENIMIHLVKIHQIIQI